MQAFPWLRGQPPASFGVNISGPEFPSNHSRYGFPDTNDWNYLKRVGVRLARLPVAAEQLFPTLASSTADATYLALIKRAVDEAGARGIGLIVDLHNFGRWASNYASDSYPGQSGDILGGANYTSAVFVAQWETIATALKGRKGLAGYGLMNEPHGMAGTNLIRGPNAMGYAGRTGVYWFVINGGVLTPAVAAGPTAYWDDDATRLVNGSTIPGFSGVLIPVTVTNAQHTFSIYARTISGTIPLQLNYAGSDIGGGNKTITTSWTRYSATWTPSAGTDNLGVLINNSTAGDRVLLANAQLELGASATTYVTSPYQPIAQAAITAIGAIDVVTPIYVCGYEYGAANLWLPNNGQMKFTTAGNPIVYEAHQYADSAGTYTSSYDTASYTATTLADQLTEYLAWGVAGGAKKFIGETGVPNDDPRYVTMIDNALHAAYLAKVRGTQWFYGVKSAQDTGRLNIAPRGNSGVIAPSMKRLLQRAA